jgi:glucose/arabinose dehydrogenase
MMKRFLPLLFASVAMAGTPQESGFSDDLFVDELSEPTCIAWAPDGSNRLFVSLKSKGIAVVENGQLRDTLFATFSSLYTASECGVLGLAFDPNYASNHFVYVFVTVSGSEQQIIRFTDQANVGTQRTKIIENLPTAGANHDGGALGFGPDGKLYWAIGDNGNGTGINANLSSLAAKVGRANKDGSVPADNPFRDGPGGANDYIWATGFRNPFTLTFQPGTGALWVNVVGTSHEQAFIVHGGDDAGYDEFEGNQPATPRYTTPFSRPLIRPKIQYRTNYSQGGGQVRNLANIMPSGGGSGQLTVTTASAHPYRVGQAILINNTTTYDGVHVVQSVPSSTQFTIPNPGSSMQTISNTGSADLFEQGGCITGGCFYDSTAFPAEYRGNFFYGDYNSGFLMRAVLDENGKPQKIVRFLEGASAPTDMALGPDGALYYAEIGAGAVRRVSYNAAQGLVVSPASLSLTEGGSGQFSVRLAAAPLADVLVQVHKTGAVTPGAHDIDVSGSPNLTFTPQNWDKPQAVTLVAAVDEDTIDDTATFSVTAPSLETVEVTATAVDENLPPLVLSTANLEVTEGAASQFTVVLPAQPTQAVKVRVWPAAGPKGKVNVVRGALMRFTPDNWSIPQTVRVRGIQDANRKDENVRLSVKSPGYLAREVTIHVVDNDPVKPAFASTPRTQTVEDLAYLYDADATGRPAPTFSLTSAPQAMTIDPVTGAISWTPTETGQVSVTIQAANRKGTVQQTFTISVNADQPPTVFITQPQEGATISGPNAEFFGSALDDYATTKAEFYVGGTLAYTDENRAGHYHLNGAHNLFDTTGLANGPLQLRMKVFDDKGQTAEATVNVTVQN